MNRTSLSRFLAIDASGGACLFAIVGLVGVLGVHPITKLRQEQTARSARLAQIQAQGDGVLEEIRVLQRSLEDIAAQTERRQHKLMSPQDLNVRIAQIIERTTANGLEALAIKPGELSIGEMYGRTPIEIAVRGPLPDVVRYLHAMRRESADLVVRRLELRPSPGGGVIAGIRTDWLTHAD